MALAVSTERKLFAGPRLRRLRAQLGLTQSRMAEELGVSVSYLNLIERNQRPLTAQFLLRLAEVFNLDLRQLTGDADDRTLADVGEVLADGLFRNLEVSRNEVSDFVQSFPAMAQALTRLYGLYRDRADAAVADAGGAGSDGRGQADAAGPLERVRDIIQERRNHFPELDEKAEAIAEELRLHSEDLFAALRDRLRTKHGISVRILPVDVLPESLRRYDYHRRQLQLSELLEPASRAFHAAYQLAYAEARQDMDRIIAGAGLEDGPAQQLLRVNLANYFAAAVMMPYGRFLAAAEQLNYDLTLLCARFGTSYEQVCHRLTTLQRPGARGVPFFLIRVDQAGNVSKRYSAGRFHFSKFGGTCPLWSLHATFRAPGQILTEVVEMPDGTRYFSIARTVRTHVNGWGNIEPQFAIGLGCELKYARQLVYSRGIDLDNPNATPIGVNCALCEREACRQRSQPPLSRTLIIDERSRGATPYRFAEPGMPAPLPR
ncbi:helix-turn-helix domain-containing protein [Pedomonas sp. V897]|uniref:helix-turn-helix domain-containing protein n=1 Tax=Pedomonas sp. V897 TaxID=3446482 RepID=UPI003EE41CEF